MARRNPAGGLGLGTLLLLGGGLFAASKLLGKKKASSPATGWELNDTCTQAEVVDAGAAYNDAVRFGSKWGSRPASATEAEDRLRLYFSSRFSQCSPVSPPETFFDVNGNTYFWAGVAQYAWQESSADKDGQPSIEEPQGAQIPRIVGAIVGGPVVG